MKIKDSNFFKKIFNIKGNLFVLFYEVKKFLKECLKLSCKKIYFNKIEKLIFYETSHKIKGISKQNINYNYLKEIYPQK